MRISDWSSDVCSSDLLVGTEAENVAHRDIAKGERGVVGDAPLLAIGLAAIDAVVEGAIEIAVLDLLIPGDLRVEYAPERRADEDGAKHAWIGAVLVQPARTLVGLGVIEDRRAADLVGRLDQQRYAQAVLMDVVEVRPAVQILGTAILAADLAGAAQRQPVGDPWDVDRAFQREVVQAAISAFDIAAQIVGRRPRADQQRAAQRVSAVQRALRSEGPRGGKG